MYENTIQDIIEAQNGNEEVMTKLLNQNTGLIWSIIKRFKDRGHELEDLYQIGVIGFMKAIKRFDIHFEVKLSTYAVPYILGEVKRFIRDDGPIKVSRSMKELGIKVKEIQKEYFLKTGAEIKLEDIAKQLHMTKEEVAVALDSFQPMESIYDATYNGEDGELSILDKLSTQADESGDLVNKLSIQQLIGELNDREKKLILLRYYKGRTQMQVADILGITQVQVSRIEKKVLSRMKVKLAN